MFVHSGKRHYNVWKSLVLYKCVLSNISIRTLSWIAPNMKRVSEILYKLCPFDNINTSILIIKLQLCVAQFDTIRSQYLYLDWNFISSACSLDIVSRALPLRLFLPPLLHCRQSITEARSVVPLFIKIRGLRREFRKGRSTLAANAPHMYIGRCSAFTEIWVRTTRFSTKSGMLHDTKTAVRYMTVMVILLLTALRRPTLLLKTRK